MRNIKIMLWYDVEDYINPQADDALLALINMMDDIGIRSSLKIVGEKIRILKERGRFDIIEKLSGHEISYHTDKHSLHPTITEYLKDMGFAQGAKEFEERELNGFGDLQRITGQFPTSFGQPGASWAPQVFPVLKKWGLPTYLDSHEIISLDEKPFWYGGILNLTKLDATMRMELEDDSLEIAKKEFDEIYEKAQGEGCQLVSIYYHPCEFSSTEFWDGVNYSNGINTLPDQWKPSPARSKEEMHMLVHRLGKFLKYTLSKPNVEYITALESATLEIRDPKVITPCDIRKMAEAFENGPDYYIRDKRTLCPSEILSLFAKYIEGKHISPEFMYGPNDDLPSKVNGKLNVGDLGKAILEQFNMVLGYKQIPDLYRIDNDTVNPIDMFCTLKKAIEMDLSPHDMIQPSIGRGKLVCAKHINKEINWQESWVIFPKDMDVSNMIRIAQLQAWTLKPALY